MYWKHAQADSIEQLEYRGIRANTKRKGKQSDKGETRIEPQHAQGVPKILPQRFHAHSARPHTIQTLDFCLNSRLVQQVTDRYSQT
jgi:hypothetical protein